MASLRQSSECYLVVTRIKKIQLLGCSITVKLSLFITTSEQHT